MRGECDSTIERVVLNDVSRNEIVIGLAGLIGEQDPTGVMLGSVIRQDGVVDRDEVDPFAAVLAFRSFEGRLGRDR